MPVASLVPRQGGFSLLEVLCALALFAVVMAALLGYHRVLQQSFTSQWQLRQLWRVAREQSEAEAPPLSGAWNVHQQQTSALGCVSIDVTVTNPAGRIAQLSRFECPRSKQRQE